MKLTPLINTCIIVPLNSFFLNCIRDELFFAVYRKSQFIRCVNIDSGFVAILNSFAFATYFFRTDLLFIGSFKIPLSKEFSSICARHFKLLRTMLTLVSFGLYVVLQFIGFRYRQRWFREARVFRLRAGYSKKLWLRCPENFYSFIKKVSPKKRLHLFFSYSITDFYDFVFLFHSARPATVYKGRGINIRYQPMFLKEGKKTRY